MGELHGRYSCVALSIRQLNTGRLFLFTLHNVEETALVCKFVCVIEFIDSKIVFQSKVLLVACFPNAPTRDGDDVMLRGNNVNATLVHG